MVKVYKYSTDFDIKSEKLQGGSYGDIINIYNKIDSVDCVLKMYKDSAFLTADIDKNIIKEIAFIEKANNHAIMTGNMNSNIVKLYGICFHDNHIYLVLEKLETDLNNAYVIKNKKLTPPENKQLLYNLLHALSELHSIGIVHNDIKSQNIMITANGGIRLIDFGISDFIGIAPEFRITNSYISTRSVKAPDDYTNPSYFHEKNRKSYATDIFSIAVAYIQIIMRNNGLSAVNRDNKIIVKDYMEIQKIDPEDLNYNPYFEANVGKGATQILLGMLSMNATKRPNTFELLQHPFFKEEQKTWKDMWGGNSKLIDNFIGHHIHYKTSDVLQNIYELSYLNVVHRSYMNSIISILNLSPKDCEMSNGFSVWILDIFNKYPVVNNFDSVINCASTYNMMFFGSAEPTQIDVLALLYNNSCLWCQNQMTLPAYLKVSSKTINPDVELELRKKSAQYVNLTHLTPVMLHIQCVLIKLQNGGKSKSGSFLNTTLQAIESYTILHVLLFYMISVPHDTICNFNVWDVVQYCAILSISHPQLDLKTKIGDELYDNMLSVEIFPIKQLHYDDISENIHTLMSKKLDYLSAPTTHPELKKHFKEILD